MAGTGHWHGVVLGRRPDGQGVTRMGSVLLLFLVNFSLVWGLFFSFVMSHYLSKSMLTQNRKRGL